MIGRAIEQIVDPRSGAGDMAVLELEDVSGHIPVGRGAVPAVRGVTLTVDAGRSLGMAGESGCGKTTLTSTVLRLLPKTATVTGGCCSRARTCSAMRWGRLRAVRWATGLGGVPGRHARAQPGAAHRRADRRADPAAREVRVGTHGPRTRGRTARAGGPAARAARRPTRTSSPAARSSA